MHKKRIIAVASLTRLFIICLQFISNLLIPDHDAGVFIHPELFSNQTVFDKVINVTLGGLLRWDAHYFVHVAKYGYTHENTIAFFPLYPLVVRIITLLLSNFVTFINESSLLLLSFIIINFVVFTKAALLLYELTTILINADFAYKCAILFCINPASIFFVAPYSESLFSYLTFKCMLNCVLTYRKCNRKCKSLIKIIIPVGFSACVRSNGILNIGFLAYFIIQECIQNLPAQRDLTRKLKYCLKNGLVLICSVYLCLIPFMFVQYYFYRQFCTDFPHNLPSFLIDFNHANNFIFPGMNSYYNQSWCYDKIPLSYSYIQSHYWNVGFLNYFEVKQIPNFMLALPIVSFLVYNSLKYFVDHKKYCLNLGIFNFQFTKFCNKDKSKITPVFKEKLFVFVVHGLFLVIFCFFCIHVQVTTRMLCSASPLLYWFAAYQFQYVKEYGSSFKNLFIFNKGNFEQRLIMYYFISYVIIGTALFSNFLPWT